MHRQPADIPAKAPGGPDVPIGFAGKRMLAAGMDGHLAKPYDIPKMMETLSELFAK